MKGRFKIMARNTKNTGSNSKIKKADYTFKGKDYTIDFYVKDKKISAKITCGCFVIYAKVFYNDDYCFLSYPSFKTKNGEFVNQAFCYDKEQNDEITKFIEKMLDELKF